MITLLVTVCLAGADPHLNPGACVEEMVTDSQLSPSLTWGGCLGIVGQHSAREFVDNHPLYSRPKYELAGWKCRNGPAFPERDI